MNFTQAIEQMKDEKAKLEQAIRTLEELNGEHRRGRPRKTMRQAAVKAVVKTSAPAPVAKKRTMSKANRDAARERMKKYWRLKRKELKAKARKPKAQKAAA
jgi:hypothetical protein